MLPMSSFSRAAYGLRDLLLNNIAELDDINKIKIGHPGDTIDDLEGLDENGLNLFFYDVNHDGFPADGSNLNPFYVRLRCLITAVGSTSNEPEAPNSTTLRDVSKGENELRMIGEVMRVLHEHPALSVTDEALNVIAELQVVPYTMDLDSINHIWSTQGETAYRLSVAYELALAPVPLRLPVDTAPLVGDSQMVAWGTMSRPPERERDGAISLKPTVEFLEIDTGRDDWTPHICLVERPPATDPNLHYVFRVQGNLAADLEVLVAGKEAGQVRLAWSVWRRKTDRSVVSWQEDIADVVPPALKDIVDSSTSTEPFIPNRIDPDDVDDRRVFNVRLPDAVRAADTQTWQAQLNAVRDWSHEEPEGSGQIVVTPLRSNTVLLYGDGP